MEAAELARSGWLRVQVRPPAWEARARSRQPRDLVLDLSRVDPSPTTPLGCANDASGVTLETKGFGSTQAQLFSCRVSKGRDPGAIRLSQANLGGQVFRPTRSKEVDATGCGPQRTTGAVSMICGDLNSLGARTNEDGRNELSDEANDRRACRKSFARTTGQAVTHRKARVCASSQGFQHASALIPSLCAAVEDLKANLGLAQCGLAGSGVHPRPRQRLAHLCGRGLRGLSAQGACFREDQRGARRDPLAAHQTAQRVAAVVAGQKEDRSDAAA